MAAVGSRTPSLQRALESSSAEETAELGRALGRLLAPGDFIGLVGELGAGKTQFVRGVADGAGVAKSEVASPSFAIVYPYRGRLPLYHADLYRVADEDELYATGFFDLLGVEAALLVEWLDRVPAAAPPELLLVRIEVEGENKRRLVAQAFGDRPRALLESWAPAPSGRGQG
ncbi:MAG: tRNA (adenosine(37)-N6)-threonylcarbamoyltransferase complex ATPase subunit type 1 TsaE [Myxococcota bacterium]